MHSVSVILMTLLGRHVYTFNKVALSFNMPHAASVICWLRKGILSPPPCPQPKVSATFATIMAFNPFVNKFGVYLDFMCTCQGCRLLFSWCCCLPKMPLRIVISGFLAKLLACRPPQAPLYNHCKCTVRGGQEWGRVWPVQMVAANAHLLRFFVISFALLASKKTLYSVGFRVLVSNFFFIYSYFLLTLNYPVFIAGLQFPPQIPKIISIVVIIIIFWCDLRALATLAGTRVYNLR